MSRANRSLCIIAAAALSMSVGSGQRRAFQEMGPEVIYDTSVDVSRIAPGHYAVEMANQFVHLRVLRARIAGNSRVPTHHHNAGLIVALTAVDLRFVAPNGQFRDVHVAAGATRWIEDDIHSEINIGGSACEFLYIENDYTGSLIPR